MSNSIERGFRYLFFYYGVYFLLLGLFDLIAVPATWRTAVNHFQCDDNFMILLVFTLLFGSRLVFGGFVLAHFRRLARWAMQQIPEMQKAEEFENSPPQREIQWYDAEVLSTFLSLFLGLYFINIGVGLFQEYWRLPLVCLTPDGITWESLVKFMDMLIDWHHPFSFLSPFVCLFGGLYLSLRPGRVARYVAQKVLTEDIVDSEEESEVKE